MVDELSREEVTDAVDRSVQELLEAAGVQAPPVDAIALAQRQLGMVVCLDRRQEARGRAQRAAGRKQIFLRPEPSEERHQWTVAHEIGDHLKAALLQRLRVPPEQVRAAHTAYRPGTHPAEVEADLIASIIVEWAAVFDDLRGFSFARALTPEQRVERYMTLHHRGWL